MSSATDFWQENQVGGPYETYDDSLQALLERQRLYPDLWKLMPVDMRGKKVLDFGCGPGHDTILFLNHGAEHVWFADISWQALQTTNERLRMHGQRERATALFADDELPRVDHFHSAGVLHHMVDPLGALLRLRVAADTGRVMVYDGDNSMHTDSLVPITEWWTHEEFIELSKEAGWSAEYVGSYECSAQWRPNCYAACYSLK